MARDDRSTRRPASAAALLGRESVLQSWSHFLRPGAAGLLTRVLRRRLQPSDEQPLRAEPFNTQQLREHAKKLAGRHDGDQHGGPDRLLSRLAENESVLLEAYEVISD